MSSAPDPDHPLLVVAITFDHTRNSLPRHAREAIENAIDADTYPLARIENTDNGVHVVMGDQVAGYSQLQEVAGILRPYAQRGVQPIQVWAVEPN